MHIPRIYYDTELVLNTPLLLNKETHHHLIDVLRLREGDAVCLFNGRGGEFIGELREVNKRQSKIMLQKFLTINNESSLITHLIQGISRGDKMDFTLQKAVELGITHITPAFTEYCNVQLTEERLQKRWQHWQTIVIQACEQSGRQRIPQVNPPLKLSDCLPKCDAQVRLVLTPHASQQLQNFSNKPQSVAILVGPEGGLSTFEIQAAEKNGFQPLRLGPRVLRTETAALVALSCIQARWGDLI
jgi:16S rRNA (uracil1498-N3)-methyltransferase